MQILIHPCRYTPSKIFKILTKISQTSNVGLLIAFSYHQTEDGLIFLFFHIFYSSEIAAAHKSLYNLYFILGHGLVSDMPHQGANLLNYSF